MNANFARTGRCHSLVGQRPCDLASLFGTICLSNCFVRALSGSPIPAMDPNDGNVPPAPRSNGWMGRVIGPGMVKTDSFAIAVTGGDTIGVIVGVDLERGAPERNTIAGIGKFSGSFIITLQEEAPDGGAAH